MTERSDGMGNVRASSDRGICSAQSQVQQKRLDQQPVTKSNGQLEIIDVSSGVRPE